MRVRKIVSSKLTKYGEKTELLECGHEYSAGNINDLRPSNRGISALRRRCYECPSKAKA